jgi:YggT family protein
MAVIAYIFNALCQLYIVVIIVGVIMSWLISFNVLNRHNRVVDAIWRTCAALTEPVLRPIRSFLPNLGGIDVSPILLLIGIRALQVGMNQYVFGPALVRGF